LGAAAARGRAQRLSGACSAGRAIGAELLRRLREAGGGPSQATRRRHGARSLRFTTGVDEVRRSRQERERQEAERARLAKLDALAKREEQVWAQVPELLAGAPQVATTRPWRTWPICATLAVHRNQRAAFDARLGIC